MAEVDFPRGGAPKKKVGVLKSKHSSGTVKGKIPNKTKTPSINSKFSITPEILHTDMLFLGCVIELKLNEVIVELPNNMKGVLTEQTPAQFNVGQWLCTRIAATTAHHSNHSQAVVPLTVRPKIVNRSLQLAHLRPGMYISGIVSSVEDRGYSVDTAISDVSSFIPKTDVRLSVGQPVFCVITDISVPSKRIFLIPQQDPDATFKDIKDWKTVSLENIRPGNATKAEVTHKYLNGLGVKIYSQPASSPLNAFIPATHLLQPVGSYSVGFRMNGKILFVDYRTQSVMVTMLPHIVNHRPNPSLYEDYFQLRGRIFSVPIPPVERPISSLPTNPPTQALLFSLSSVEPEPTSSEPGSEGTPKTRKHEIEVKVVGVSFLLNVVTASADPVLLEDENSVLEIADLHPGMLVHGSVKAVSKMGLEVYVSPAIPNARCQPNHLTDAPSIQNVQALFNENEQVQCRVLHIEADETVFITNKPTLVNSPLRIITSYQHAVPGCVAHGWISKVTRSEAFVSFYNNVTGVVPSSNIKGAPESIYHAGEVVVCQVVACKLEHAKAEKFSLILTFDIQLANRVPDPLNISALRKAFSSVSIGEIVSGIVAHTDTNGLTLVLESGITGILPTQHLSDSLAICNHLLSGYYVGTKLTDVLVLNKDSSNMRLVLSKKVSLQSLVSTYEHFTPGQVVPAHIKQISDVSITVGFLGTVKATVSSDGGSYALGQSVRVLIKDVDNTGEPTVDLFDAATKTSGLLLLQEYFSGVDIVWSRMNMAKLHIGDVVSGSVTEHRRYQLMIRLENHLLAFVDTRWHPDDRNHQLGNVVSGVVIDVDYENAIVQLSLDQNLVKNIIMADTIVAGKELFGKVLLTKPAYAVVLSVLPPPLTNAAHNQFALVYVPATDYNTQAVGVSSTAIGSQYQHQDQYRYRVGQEVRVLKDNDSGGSEHLAWKRPLFMLKDNTPSHGLDGKQKKVKEVDYTIHGAEGTEDTNDAEDADMVFGGEESTSAEDTFEYHNNDFTNNDYTSSDSEPDPDVDDLQAYLARVAKAKGKSKQLAESTAIQNNSKGQKELSKQKATRNTKSKQKREMEINVTNKRNKKVKK